MAVIYETFFASIRKSLYGGSIPSTAVTALRLIIAEAEPRGVKIADLAYMMATAFHEVGPALIPKRESLNYSASALIDGFSRKRISVADANRLGRKPRAPALGTDVQKQIANLIYGGAWGKANLGNVKPNDGWDYRGGGYPQVTGLANYDKVSKLTGIDLVARPERITEQDVACISLVVCMIEGTYTGRKLSSYNLPAQFKEARAIINNDVSLNGEKIAGHARKFMAALTAAGYLPGKPASVAAPEHIKAEEVKSKAVPAVVPVGTLIAGGAAGFAFSWWDWIAAKFCAWFSLFCGG